MGSTLFQASVLHGQGQGTLKGVLFGVRCHWHATTVTYSAFLGIFPPGAPTPVPYVPSTPNGHSGAPVSE